MGVVEVVGEPAPPLIFSGHKECTMVGATRGHDGRCAWHQLDDDDAPLGDPVGAATAAAAAWHVPSRSSQKAHLTLWLLALGGAALAVGAVIKLMTTRQPNRTDRERVGDLVPLLHESMRMHPANPA